MPQALVPVVCFGFIIVSPDTLLYRRNRTEAIKQGTLTVWCSALITSVVLLGKPSAYLITAFKTYGTKKSSLTMGCGETDGASPFLSV